MIYRSVREVFNSSAMRRQKLFEQLLSRKNKPKRTEQEIKDELQATKSQIAAEEKALQGRDNAVPSVD